MHSFLPGEDRKVSEKAPCVFIQMKATDTDSVSQTDFCTTQSWDTCLDCPIPAVPHTRELKT